MGRGKLSHGSTKPEPSQGAEVLHETFGTFKSCLPGGISAFQKCAVSRAGLDKGNGT